MKSFYASLLLLSSSLIFRAQGQAPTQTANDYVRPYQEPFQYGCNMGYYGQNWNDESLAGLVQKLGGHSLRPTLPDHFVETYGYNVRTGAFNTYVNTLGMKELTCFVEGPSAAHRDPATYPGASERSKLFAHLYEPIWNADGSVNANNYYANYLYKLLQTYGDKVRFWEVVNEPDFTNGANPDAWLTRAPLPGEMVNLQAPIYTYVRMLRISYEVIHKYHPEAYVTTGGVGYPQFVDALLRYTDNPDGGKVTAQYPRPAGAYLDALSFHSYPSYSLHYWDNSIGGFRYTRTSDYAASRVMDDRQAMASVLTKYGYGTIRPAKLLLMTETDISRRTSDDRTGTDEMQRNFGIKTLVLAQKNAIKQLYFFCLAEGTNAPAAGQSVSGSDEINLMGFYENLNRDAPGAQKTTELGQAFATTSKLLYGYQYDAARTVALALPASVEGGAFSKEGSYVYVLWAKALVDNSEQAIAIYSFPAAWGLSTVRRAEWNYASTGAQATQPAQNLSLSGAPAFFTEASLATAPSAPTAPAAPGGGAASGGGCEGAGTLLREQWDNVAGAAVTAIPLATAPTRSAPVTQFETSGSPDMNYGARLRGYICPPLSGSYTFWVSGDDVAELYLSPDDNPAHKVRIAACSSWTSGIHDFSRAAAQQSAPVPLTAGQRYYVEALHKQGWGSSYLSVAWQRPDNTRQEPIPGSALLPYVTATSTAALGAMTSSKARITFTFASPPPAGTTARLAPTLYNKARVLQYEEDDCSVKIFTDAYPLLRGGIAREGQVYPGLRYSDGCGHDRPYAAAVALNGHNVFNNSVCLDEGPNHVAGGMVWAQAQTLLDNGWDVENHSDLHTADNPARQIADLDALIASRLRGYKPSVHVVPTNFAGYPTAAFDAGYIAVSSTSQSDGLPTANQWTAERVPLSTLPLPTTRFVYQRYGADLDRGSNETTESQLNRLKVLSDNLLAAGPDPSGVYLQRVFSHGIDFGVLRDWFTYTQGIAQDRLWVTTLREFSEYRRVSSQVVLSEQLLGNTLTVDLDYAGVSPETRFQNLSLLVDSPGTLTNISVSGADSTSFNVNTKLVNIFRHQGAAVLTAAAPGRAGAARTELSIFPNPCGQQATVEFSVPQSGPVTLALYNLQGQLVRQLFAGPVGVGTPRRVALPAAGLRGGLYVVRLVTATGTVNQKLSCTGD